MGGRKHWEVLSLPPLALRPPLTPRLCPSPSIWAWLSSPACSSSPPFVSPLQAVSPLFRHSLPSPLLPLPPIALQGLVTTARLLGPSGGVSEQALLALGGWLG